MSFALSDMEQSSDTRFAFTRLPSTVLWIWINLLPFTIGNQRQQESIEEDSHNKPWRPFPAKRISPECAIPLMGIFYTLAALTSIRVGGSLQCMALLGLGYWYNDSKGADCSIVVRNLINGAGYIAFVSGALEVTLQKSATSFQPQTLLWLLIVGTVVLTSIHAHDMADQAGDRLRSRRTVPLVFGDGVARWAIVIAITTWSFACPAFWQIDSRGYILPLLVGGIVSGRFWAYRTVAADKKSTLIYNMWIVVLYFLPLIKRLQDVDSAGSTQRWPRV